jgi:hypothetical protein
MSQLVIVLGHTIQKSLGSFVVKLLILLTSGAPTSSLRKFGENMHLGRAYTRVPGAVSFLGRANVRFVQALILGQIGA